MAGYIPPIKPVDIAMVMFVLSGCVTLAFLRAGERRKAEAHKPPEEDPDQFKARDDLIRHYKRKWSSGSDDAVVDPLPAPKPRGR